MHLYQQFKMVFIYASFTTPVNPPGAMPMLSHAQLWQRKVRYPHEFLPVVASCDVQSEAVDPDNEGVLVVNRTIVFKRRLRSTRPPGRDHEGDDQKLRADQGGLPLRRWSRGSESDHDRN